MSPTYWFFLSLARLIARTCFSLEVRGREHLEPLRGQGCLLAMNHQSNLDPPVSALCCPWPIHFLAKKELMDWPVLGRFFPALNVIPIDQARPDMSALRAVIRMVKNRQTAIIFPEGSRTLDGRLQPAQPGLGLIVAKTMVPVVPMRITGAYDAMPAGAGSGNIRCVPIRVQIGPVLRWQPADLTGRGEGRELYQSISEEVMAAIARIEVGRGG